MHRFTHPTYEPARHGGVLPAAAAQAGHCPPAHLAPQQPGRPQRLPVQLELDELPEAAAVAVP